LYWNHGWSNLIGLQVAQLNVSVSCTAVTVVYRCNCFVPRVYSTSVVWFYLEQKTIFEIFKEFSCNLRHWEWLETIYIFIGSIKLVVWSLNILGVKCTHMGDFPKLCHTYDAIITMDKGPQQTKCALWDVLQMQFFRQSNCRRLLA